MRLALQGVLVASLVLAVASCSDASNKAQAVSSSTGSPASATASSAASTASSDPRTDAQGGLDAYWAMVKRLLAAPDPSDPEIGQRAVDPARSALQDLLITRQTQGEVAQFDGVSYHVDTNVSISDGQSAQFEGCIVDGARLVNDTSGEVVNDKVTTSRIRGTLILSGGSWKMQRFDVLRKVDGEVACATLA